MAKLPSSAAASAASQQLPYRWGTAQGCLQILWGTVILLFGWLMFRLNYDGGGRVRIILVLIEGVIYIPLGIGILRKRTYGLVLVFVSAGFAFIVYYLLVFREAQPHNLPSLRLLYWILSSFYYLRRRHEFVRGW